MRALALVTAFAGFVLLGTGAAGIARWFGASPRTRRGVVALATVVAALASAATAGYALFAVSTSASIDVATAVTFTPIAAPSCSWTEGAEVTLTWDADPDATSYDVLRSTMPNSGYALLSNVDDSTFTYADSTVNPDPRPVGIYYYKIRVNTVGAPKTSTAANSTTCAGYVDTWAGGEGNGRDATDVAMGPQGLDVVGSDLYVAANQVVRKIDLGTGATTVIAGTGTAGPAGVPGPGELANVGTADVAVDGDGNRYITDSSAHVVYKVDDQGDASVFAGQSGSQCGDPTGGCGNGGQATSAQLSAPTGIAVDDDGNVYIADSLDHAVRRVDAGGVITRIVGTGDPCADSTDPCGDGGSATAAQLNTPLTVEWGNGGLFINDNADHRIRFWNGATIEAVAGNGSSISAYGGDGGDGSDLKFDRPMAYARDGDDAVVAQFDGRVRLYRSGNWQTIAGLGPAATGAPDGDSGFATEARIPSIPPGGVALWHGQVFISDPVHRRVRVVGRDGRIGTYAGSGSACVPVNGCGDGGLALDADITPGALAIDTHGTLYIADTGADEIRAVGTSGIMTKVAGTGVACADPTDACGDGGDPLAAQFNGVGGLSTFDDYLLVADTGDRRVRAILFSDDTPTLIDAIAGTGASGDTGDGGAANAATFMNPVAVTATNGHFLVADPDAHRVRSFLFGGNISAYAGDSTAGNSGDGGAATSARLDSPVALGTTADGKSVIVDLEHNRIRAVDESGGPTIDNLYGDAGGAVATWAGDGGAATDAAMNPFELAWDDADEYLYLADSYAGRIRRVDIGGDDTITTVAGTGSSPIPPVDRLGYPFPRFFGDGGPAVDAGLTVPAGLAVDASGNLYVGELITGRVRKIDHGTGDISTIVGTGDATNVDASPPTDAQFGAISGAARDASGYVYVADNRHVRKVTDNDTTTIAGTGALPTWGGDDGAAASAQLDAPAAIAQDSFGNTYVADGARIRRIGPDGTIHAFAGNGDPGYSGNGDAATNAMLSRVGGIAADTDGSVYFTDVDNHVVRKVDTGGTITTVAGTGGAGYDGDSGAPTSAAIGSPIGIAMESTHVFYVADQDHAVVRRVDLDGDTITTFAGSGIAGYSGDNGSATSARLDHPTALASSDGGLVLYIFDSDNHRIRQVVSGNIGTTAGDGTAGGSGDGGPAIDARLGASIAISSSDLDGTLYIADASNNRTREITPGGVMEGVTGDELGAAGFGGDGGDPADGSVRFNVPAGIVATTSRTTGVRLLVADSGNQRVRSIALDGSLLTTFAGDGNPAAWGGDGGDATDAAMAGITAIGSAADGTVYFAEHDTNDVRIRRFAPNGEITTVAGGAPCADPASPCGDVGDPLDARFTQVNALAVTHVEDLDGVYTGDLIFVSDGNRVRVVVPGYLTAPFAGQAASGDGASGDGGPATDASLGSPAGLAFKGTVGSPGFELYVADGASHRVRMVNDVGDITLVAGNGDNTSSGDGGNATSAGIPSPVGLALNAAGDLYIVGNNAYSNEGAQLRRVDHTTGHISTVAGDGTSAQQGDRGGALGARIADARALFFDDDGNLYVVQGSAAGRIRRIVGPQ